jgi:hypothetical protein
MFSCVSSARCGVYPSTITDLQWAVLVTLLPGPAERVKAVTLAAAKSAAPLFTGILTACQPEKAKGYNASGKAAGESSLMRLVSAPQERRWQ